MHRSADRILTTHVGSLPRSQRVVDVLFARERGGSGDGEADSKVIGLNRIEQPLVRVRSRFPERIEITREILREYEDVESFVIDFRPRRTAAEPKE